MTQVNREREIHRNRESQKVNSEVESLFFENYIAADRVAQLRHLNWMTTVEAAQYLRVSVGSIKNMVWRGQLLPKKLGRRNRFWKDDLDRTLQTPFITKGKF